MTKEQLLTRLEAVNVHITQHQQAIQDNQARTQQFTTQLHGWMGARDELNHLLQEIEKENALMEPCEPEVASAA